MLSEHHLAIAPATYYAAKTRPPSARLIVDAPSGVALGPRTIGGDELFINQLAGAVFGPASSVFYDTLLAYLERGWQVLAWLGLILVVAGWFAGSNRSGAAVRRTLSTGLQTIGTAVSDGPLGGAGRWVAANARWLRIAIGVLGAVVLLWGNDVSPSRLLWSLLLVVALLAIVQVLVGARGRTRATNPVPIG